MTNLEWIRTLSEEEFADWLYDEWLHHLQYRWSSSRGGLIIWLKDRKTEPQTETKTETQNSNLTFEKADEPHTDTEIARAIAHKMIEDAVIAEDAYPDLRQRMHDAVDNYEPQTERSE